MSVLPGTVRVALGWHEPLLCGLLRRSLAARGALVVVEATNADTLAVLVAAESPAVAILDDGLLDHDDDVAAALVARLVSAGTAVIVLTAEPLARRVLRLLAAGAAGALDHDGTPDDLAEAILAAATGAAALDPRSAAWLLGDWRNRSDSPDRSPTPGALSPRELEVLHLLAKGGTTRTIGSDLGVSPKTVENHKTRIFAKLGVRSQAEAVSTASTMGLLG
jgi:DNA-binding NarL/FixJ family response regulator